MLKFCNTSSGGVWLAILYYDPDCPSKFRDKGWWHVSVGQCVIVYGGSLRNLGGGFWYFAEDDVNHNKAWAGAIARQLPGDHAFDFCDGETPPNSNIRVGFRQITGIDGSGDDFTVTLWDGIHIGLTTLAYGEEW